MRVAREVVVRARLVGDEVVGMLGGGQEDVILELLAKLRRSLAYRHFESDDKTLPRLNGDIGEREGDRGFRCTDKFSADRMRRITGCALHLCLLSHIRTIISHRHERTVSHSSWQHVEHNRVLERHGSAGGRTEVGHCDNVGQSATHVELAVRSCLLDLDTRELEPVHCGHSGLGIMAFFLGNTFAVAVGRPLGILQLGIRRVGEFRHGKHRIIRIVRQLIDSHIDSDGPGIEVIAQDVCSIRGVGNLLAVVFDIERDRIAAGRNGSVGRQVFDILDFGRSISVGEGHLRGDDGIIDSILVGPEFVVEVRGGMRSRAYCDTGDLVGGISTIVFSRLVRAERQALLFDMEIRERLVMRSDGRRDGIHHVAAAFEQGIDVRLIHSLGQRH